MALSEQQLDRLDELLLHMPQETMFLPTLDGFLTGIVLSPEDVPVAEWLPLVWGEAGTAEKDLFQQADAVKEATGLIMTHFNWLARQLERPSHQISPEFSYHDGPGYEEIGWESWTVGFFEAVLLRLPAWEEVLESEDEEAAASFSMLCALDLIDSGDCDLPQETQDELTEIAPGLIPLCIAGLNQWRLKQRQGRPNAPVRLSEKLGRNDPCPCGSGKKFKKCCGAG